MGQIGVKMNILWLKQTQWQFCKFEKTYFESSRGSLRFSKQQSVFPKTLRMAGYKTKFLRVSLEKHQAERVSSNLVL